MRVQRLGCRGVPSSNRSDTEDSPARDGGVHPQIDPVPGIDHATGYRSLVSGTIASAAVPGTSDPKGVVEVREAEPESGLDHRGRLMLNRG